MPLHLRRARPTALAALVAVVGVGAVPPAAASTGQSVSDVNAITAEQLVAQLVGPGVTVSNVSYAGDAQSAGVFSGLSALGLDSGVVLSSGRAVDILGPHGGLPNSIMGTPGDDQLQRLTGVRSWDAAVLEFDFVPRAATLAIEYVFGSAEYPFRAGSSYWDGFAFFVNGVNCAAIDGAPVDISTVNHETNAGLFVDNSAGTEDTALSGFTVPLRCSAPVSKGEVNRAKLVVADGYDHLLDSAVLIAAAGIASNTPPRAADLSFTLAAGASATIALPGIDDDDEPLSYSIASGAAHGLLDLSGGTVSYTPVDGFIGDDAFEYRVSDGIATSGPYRVSISVTAPDPAAGAPIVRDVAVEVFSGEDTPIVLVDPIVRDVALNPGGAPAPDAEQATFAIVEDPTHGTLSGTGAHRSYRSDPTFSGTDSFAYTASRAGVTSAPVTITLAVSGRPVPPATSRSVPVFAPDAVPVTAEGSRERLAATGAEIGTTLAAGVALALGALLTGAATLVVCTARRRRADPTGAGPSAAKL